MRSNQVNTWILLAATALGLSACGSSGGLAIIWLPLNRTIHQHPPLQPIQRLPILSIKVAQIIWLV